MKPGQLITRWWQQVVRGELCSPQAIVAASRVENPDPAQASDRFLSIPPDVKWDAPERLRAPNFMLTDSFARQWDRADWQHVDPRLMRWSALFIEYARKRQIPLYVHCAMRTEAEQADAVARKVSKTPYPRSGHNIGEAVDIVHGVYHWDMSRQEWNMLGVLGRLALDRLNATLPKVQQLQLTWGGDWSDPWDPAHWEISDYKARIKRLPLQAPVRYTPRRILRMG
ncbi:MAG: hypothetical protein [Microviridae sp.]|nr:MAG: hypothetical protein [Microviridae sp.]